MSSSRTPSSSLHIKSTEDRLSQLLQSVIDHLFKIIEDVLEDVLIHLGKAASRQVKNYFDYGTNVALLNQLASELQLKRDDLQEYVEEEEERRCGSMTRTRALKQYIGDVDLAVQKAKAFADSLKESGGVFGFAYKRLADSNEVARLKDEMNRLIDGGNVLIGRG